MKFKLASDHKLYYQKDESLVPVELVQCFPLTYPNEYYSLLDSEGLEIELFENFDHLTQNERSLLEQYLNSKSYKCMIIGIHSIEEDFGLRNFKVKTNMGDRTFQMPLDEWPKESRNGQILFEDVFGEKFILERLEFGHNLLKTYV